MRYYLSLALVLLVAGCGKKTPPVPYGSLQPLPVIEKARTYVRAGTLVIDWQVPGETLEQRKVRAESISAYRVRFVQPEPGCFACRPEPMGELLVSPLARLLEVSEFPPEALTAYRFRIDRYRLEIPLEALPSGDYLRVQLDYFDLEGASAPAGASLPVRRPGPIPQPKIHQSQWGPADCGESCPELAELRLRWRRDLARVVEVIDPAGGRYQVEEHYRLRLFYLDQGVERLAHDEALLTDQARLKLHKRPLLARQEDRYGNLGPATEINP